MEFIEVITTDRKGNKTRQSCLGVSENNPKNTVSVIGVVQHGTYITFDKKNAQKMIDFCQKIVDSK